MSRLTPVDGAPGPGAVAELGGSVATDGAVPSQWIMRRSKLSGADERAPTKLDYPSLIARAEAVHDRIQRYRTHFDRRQQKLAVFAATYLKSTEGVLEKLREDARCPESERFFKDPAFIADLTDEFARRYFMAMDRVICVSGGKPPFAPLTARLNEPGSEPWSSVHRIIERRRSTAYLDFAYAALVHINYDLPIVLSTLGLYDAKGQALNPTKIEDFERFNGVLGDRIDRVQDEVMTTYDRRAWVVDALAWRLDEFIGARAVKRARDRALRDARSFVSGEREPKAFEGAFAGFVRRLSWVVEPIRIVLALTRRPGSRAWPDAGSSG